ncbi:MAG: hypothetical protein HYW06_09360 [Gemmatimonadetes bacterium]|nr:hypothetical protein [Gemmatimonadota bacterium]
MSAMRRLVFAPAATLLLPAYVAACFHYVPIDVPPLPKAQTEVRVTLASPMDISMGEFTLNDVTRIEGIVTEVNGDTLGLVARWLHPRAGNRYDAMFGSYDIPVTNIEQLEAWRLSGRRTAILLGATAAGVAVFFDLIRRVVSGDRPGDIPPPEASILVPR